MGGSLAPHFRDLLPSCPSRLGFQWGVRAVVGPTGSGEETTPPPLPAKFLSEDRFCIFFSSFSLSVSSFLPFSSSSFLFICLFLFFFPSLFSCSSFFPSFFPDLFSFLIHCFISFFLFSLGHNLFFALFFPPQCFRSPLTFGLPRLSCFSL